MISNNCLLEILTNLQKFILTAENLKGSGNDKKDFVISCLIGFIPEGETKTILMPLIPSLIDFAVNLMNSEKMLSIKKKCGCTGG